MALGTLSRTAKVFYERVANQLRSGMSGIDQFLFSTPDVDTSAAFSLDSLIVSPHGVAFRKTGEQSAVREYKGGTGQIIEVPRASEKTPITERLRDSVIAGIEETAAQSTHEASLLNQIITQHASAHYATKCKLAIDVIRTGAFSPLGLTGFDIDLEVDFNRSGTQSLTYDFTDVGASVDNALGALYDAYRDTGGAPGNICVIMGSRWLREFESDSDVMDRMQNNALNLIVQTSMVPEELQRTQDLYLIGRYRIPGKATPIWLCSYSPENQYTPYKNATAVDFFPDDEAVIFGIGARRYRVFRGVDVLDDSGQAVRAVGDLVFDSYTTEDPVQTWLRSSTRYIFVPAEIDHTAKSVGTFSES